MGLLGGIIGGLGSLGQSLIDRKTQQMNIDKTFKRNMELSKYQYSKDLEMWNRQNQYNSPMAQMERFKQANLNPNLIYGQGTSGNATTLPKYQAPSYEFKQSPIEIAGVLNSYLDADMKSAQIDNIKAQRRVIQAKGVIEETKSWFSAFNEKLKSDILWSQNEMKLMEYALGMEGFRQYFDPIQGGNYKVKPEYKEKLKDYFGAQLSKPVFELVKTNADIARIQAQSDLTKIQGKYLPVQTIGGIGKSLVGTAGSLLSRGTIGKLRPISRYSGILKKWY